MVGIPFFSLPREIRDMIYEYAFSPTGYVTPIFSPLKRYPNFSHSIRYVPLVPCDPLTKSCRGNLKWGDHKLKPLAILPTSRQFCSEALEVYWKANKLFLTLSPQLNCVQPNIPLLHTNHVRTVHLQRILGALPLSHIEEDLNSLFRWRERGGRLHSVTLGLVLCTGDKTTWPAPIPKHKILERTIAAFRKLQETEFPKWEGKVHLALEILEPDVASFCKTDPRELVKVLHEAFGGEFKIAGRLCYKNGVELLQPFKREDGRWQLSFEP